MTEPENVRIYTKRFFDAMVIFEYNLNRTGTNAQFIVPSEYALPTPCFWTFDDDTCSWDTYCGNKFTLIDGSPLENGMKFCCYCGAPLAEYNCAPKNESEYEYHE